MNIVVLPIVFAAVMISMLGVYHMSVNSEYAMTQNSMDSISQLADRSNEILDAKIANSTILIESHSLGDSEIFLIDFTLHDGEKKRVIYSDDDTFDGDTPIQELRQDPDDAPVIDSGARKSLSLQDFKIAQSDISSASILTENGNRFLIDLPYLYQDQNGTSDGTGDGKATIAGMGINSRITQTFFEEAYITHGSGMIGTGESVKPYVVVETDTDFAAMVSEDDTYRTLLIPRFWVEYDSPWRFIPYNINEFRETLQTITPYATNVLGYSEARTLDGEMYTDMHGSIRVSGNGSAIILLNDYAGRDMLLRGYAAGGTFEIITSDIDLMSADTLPPYEGIRLPESFLHPFTFPDSGRVYIYAENARYVKDAMFISAEYKNDDAKFLKINDLSANIPYEVIQDGRPITTGMTSQTGSIIIDVPGAASSTRGGYLRLYDDSMAYRGSFSTILFDELNDEVLHIPTDVDRVYVAHAYAVIPVIGNVTVSGLNLDGTLPIPYLDGPYQSGNSIHVPVVPGYDTIHLEINGIPISLPYGNILGGTGITIAEPATSTIELNSPSSPIRTAEAVAGTTAYAIAPSSGNLKAIISETISGSITITNTYNLKEKNPPPPPPPRRIDPLSGYVDVFVNGELVKSKTLGVNPYPDFVPQHSRNRNTVTMGVTYEYPDYTLSGTASVPVQAGDFVEFYVYGKVYGEIDGYVIPSGYVLSSSSGVSTATANIRSAHITTDM